MYTPRTRRQTETPKPIRKWQTCPTSRFTGVRSRTETNYLLVVCQPFPRFAENICNTFGMTLLNSEYFARHVANRMAELGLTQAAIYERGGPSDTTLRKILEGAPVRMTTSTVAKFDRSLDWVKGSAVRTLAGGDPEPIDSPSDNFKRAVDIARRIVDAEPTPHDTYFSRAERLLSHAHDSVRRADYLGAIHGLEGVVSTAELLITRVTDSAIQQREGEAHAESAAPTTHPPATTPGTSGASYQEADAGDRQRINVHPLKRGDQGDELDGRPIAADHGEKGPKLPPSDEEYSQDPDDHPTE